MNWTSWDIDQDLSRRVQKDLMQVPAGTYRAFNDGVPYSAKLEGFHVLPTPVTNALFVEGLNRCRIRNHQGGVYKFLNDVNVNLPLYYDGEEERYRVRPGYEDHPVRGVTWQGAVMFAALAGCRLPTELEWEVCARGGRADIVYPWGNRPPSPQLANYGNIVGNTTRVRTYAANAWGLYDVAGNVREWCADGYHPSYPFLLNRNGKEEVHTEYRVVKGGAWDKTEKHLQCSIRAGKWLRIGTAGIGFRVVRCDADDPRGAP